MPRNDLREQKNLLREKHRKIRAGFSEAEKSACDEKLCGSLCSLCEYKKSRLLLAFSSKNIEVNTEKIILRALEDGKSLELPKCRADGAHMDFYRVLDLSSLKTGAYSILEPDSERCEKITDFSDSLCIVPGLCFDLRGYRIGFGKGFYDRFLADFQGTVVGLCYSQCVENRIPTNAFDKPVDILITERLIIDTRK